jgi:hypothetical protein
MPYPYTTPDGTPYVSPLIIAGITGRNGSNSSFDIPDNQCLEAYNVDWFRSSVGRKRGGATALSVVGGTAVTGGFNAIARHVPDNDETAAEFWAVGGNLIFKRLAGSAVWADPTVQDAILNSPQEVAFKSFNGKLYVAYKSALNRLHVWDPVSNSLRRVGIAKAAPPTFFSLLFGTVNDTRKYRIAFTKQIAGITVQRGELSDPTAAQVSVNNNPIYLIPALPGEGETHWELWAASISSAYADYRLVSTLAVSVPTQGDNNANLPSTVAPADGFNSLPPSCRYMVADDARIIMGGAYETTAGGAIAPKNNRVWWTALLGASDVGDDERVLQTGTFNSYSDVEEAITGISEPFQVVAGTSTSLEKGSFYVFSFRGQWKFVQTGTATSPYIRFRVAGGAGCIHHKSIVTYIDENGQPSIYWAAQNGIYRISAEGQQFCSEDIIDIWATVNLDAAIPCHAIAYPDLHQIWFYIATGSNSYPNQKVVFDTRLGRVASVGGVRQGWALHEGESTKAYCSCLFSDTVGATMGRRLKPYIGYTAANQIFKCDTSAQDDNGTPFSAYVDSKSYAPWGLGNRGNMKSDPVIVAASAPGVTIQLSVYRDEGAEITYSRVNLTPSSDSAQETKVVRYLEGTRLSQSVSFRCRIGDQQAVASSWNLDALVVPLAYDGAL